MSSSMCNCDRCEAERRTGAPQTVEDARRILAVKTAINPPPNKIPAGTSPVDDLRWDLHQRAFYDLLAAETAAGLHSVPNKPECYPGPGGFLRPPMQVKFADDQLNLEPGDYSARVGSVTRVGDEVLVTLEAPLRGVRVTGTIDLGDKPKHDLSIGWHGDGYFSRVEAEGEVARLKKELDKERQRANMLADKLTQLEARGRK